jgi:tRNA(fMet)-specific endonuclease VapC
MPDYLLDTNHASPLVTKGHPLRDRVLEAMKTGNSFAIAAPCVTEVLFGISLLPRAVTNRRNWAFLIRDLTVYGVDRADAEVAAELQIQLRRQGWQLGTVDALVAAIALRYHRTLLTTDGDFARVPGLTVENWRSAEAGS